MIKPGKHDGGTIRRPASSSVVDEADSLAQSREQTQMHHEDRAGVNALLRGIDDFTTEGLPIVVVLCH